MSKISKENQSLKPDSPTTPKNDRKRTKSYDCLEHTDSNSKSGNSDSDSDCSMYSLTFSQPADCSGLGVTWIQDTSPPIKFKSRRYRKKPEESPKYIEIREPNESKPQKGLYKFLKCLESLGVSIKGCNEAQPSADNSKVALNADNFNTNPCHLDTSNYQNANDNNFYKEDYSKLFDDSEDMDLVICSQKAEQEFSRLKKIETFASKGFCDILMDDDDDALLANLDDPQLTQKSTFARHHSIATSMKNVISSNNVIVETKSGCNAHIYNEPLSSLSPTSKSTLLRHRSMPSPSAQKFRVREKRCTPEEIAIKRKNAIAILKSNRKKMELKFAKHFKK